MKTIEVVVAVIFREGKVLCVQRDEHAKEYVSLKWEFPGGKVEVGESREEALVREIEEELAVEELDQLDWAAADVPVVEYLKRS